MYGYFAFCRAVSNSLHTEISLVLAPQKVGGISSPLVLTQHRGCTFGHSRLAKAGTYILTLGVHTQLRVEPDSDMAMVSEPA